jgi:hypothetical protein
MPGGRDPDHAEGAEGPDHAEGAEGGAPPRLSLRNRLLLALPRFQHGPDKAPLGERLRNAVLKPVDPDAKPTGKGARASDKPSSMEEIETEVRFANDQERLIGLFAAPVGAAIGLVVIGYLIAKDPPALLKNGTANKLHVSVALYHDLTYVLLGLSLAMLASAYFRKRLYLGIAMALYGLAVFNLHYWGFGIPFLFGGAYLLVRSYRLQRELAEATGTRPTRPGAGARRGGPPPPAARARPNKRYTPRNTRPKRRSPAKPENEQRAG